MHFSMHEKLKWFVSLVHVYCRFESIARLSLLCGFVVLSRQLGTKEKKLLRLEKIVFKER